VIFLVSEFIPSQGVSEKQDCEVATAQRRIGKYASKFEG